MISFLIVGFIKSFYRFYLYFILFIFILITHFNSHSTKMQNLSFPSTLNREDNVHNVLQGTVVKGTDCTTQVRQLCGDFESALYHVQQ